MKRMITICPSCHEEMKISALKCPECGLEIHDEFEPSRIDRLNNEQYDFLIAFLKNRGNLKALQEEWQISYPLAKKKLGALLTSLGIEASSENEKEQQKGDISNMIVDKNSAKASEIVKAKLKEEGGRVIVHTVRGLPCEIVALEDGKSFFCDKLPIRPPYQYEVFDIIVDLLVSNHGRARKGNGRNYKLGQAECDESTVVGAIAAHYSRKKKGESVFDPVFALAAVLDWAGIAHNERGELVLTAEYRSKL